jgi:NADH-quinone oxidoreductase subunit M
MISVSIGFGLFPMHLYNVVRSGVDPLVAKITQVVPVASQERESSGVKREAMADSYVLTSVASTPDASRLTPHALRGSE